MVCTETDAGHCVEKMLPSNWTKKEFLFIYVSTNPKILFLDVSEQYFRVKRSQLKKILCSACTGCAKAHGQDI